MAVRSGGLLTLAAQKGTDMSANDLYPLTEIRYLELILNAKHGGSYGGYVVRFQRELSDENGIQAVLILTAPADETEVRSICRDIYMGMYEEVSWQAFFWVRVTGKVRVQDSSSSDWSKHSTYYVELNTSENLFANNKDYFNVSADKRGKGETVMSQHQQDDIDRQAFRRVFSSVNTYSQFNATELRTIRDIVLSQLYPTPSDKLLYHQEQVARASAEPAGSGVFPDDQVGTTSGEPNSNGSDTSGIDNTWEDAPGDETPEAKKIRLIKNIASLLFACDEQKTKEAYKIAAKATNIPAASMKSDPSEMRSYILRSLKVIRIEDMEAIYYALNPSPWARKTP
jgi:hypothetical protein